MCTLEPRGVKRVAKFFEDAAASWYSREVIAFARWLIVFSRRVAAAEISRYPARKRLRILRMR